MKAFFIILSFLSIYVISDGEEKVLTPPHIIFIYADDLGWNDVSFHGSPEIPTPNIDALAMNGILLNNYYGEHMCTPSRAALLTGKYPFKLGLHQFVLKAGEASAVPLKEITMAQRLKTLGYDTHMIGKWHLGYMKKEYTPTFRGFDTFFGHYNGMIDYYDYTAETITGLPNTPYFHGIDLHNGTKVVKDFRGQYATHTFTKKAEDIIRNHNTSKPLFLYLSHLAVHSGNKNNPLQAPPQAIRKFKYIKDLNRRLQAAMTSVMDESVGNIIETLHYKNMLRNSIVVFASDNGGQLNGIEGGYSSNYPLRGKKVTLWEGGIRVPALIWSPLFKLQEPRVSEQLMHVTDWLPTFYSAAGGDSAKLGDIDGQDMWKALSNNLPSPRIKSLHFVINRDDFSVLRKGDWKLVMGTSPEGYDEWYGPKGTEHMDVPNSMAEWVFSNGSSVRNILIQNGLWIIKNVDRWYKESQVVCGEINKTDPGFCHPVQKPSLFNMKDDPCEMFDLAPFYPEIVDSLTEELFSDQKSAVKPQSKPSDPRANPMCYDFAHVTWMDSEYLTQHEQCDFSE